MTCFVFSVLYLTKLILFDLLKTRDHYNQNQRENSWRMSVLRPSETAWGSRYDLFCVFNFEAWNFLQNECTKTFWNGLGPEIQQVLCFYDPRRPCCLWSWSWSWLEYGEALPFPYPSPGTPGGGPGGVPGGSRGGPGGVENKSAATAAGLFNKVHGFPTRN